MKSARAQTNAAPLLCFISPVYLIKLPKGGLFSQTLTPVSHTPILQQPNKLFSQKQCFKQNIFEIQLMPWQELLWNRIEAGLEASKKGHLLRCYLCSILKSLGCIWRESSWFNSHDAEVSLGKILNPRLLPMAAPLVCGMWITEHPYIMTIIWQPLPSPYDGCKCQFTASCIRFL